MVNNDYQIIRSWREKKGRLEVFDLYVNGSRDITGAWMWNDRIQDISSKNCFTISMENKSSD